MKSQDFAVNELADNQPDHEVEMAKKQLYFAAKNAIELHGVLKQIGESQGLDGWVQSKITKAADYLQAVHNHLVYDEKVAEPEPPAFTFEHAEAALSRGLGEMSVGGTGAGGVAIGGTSMPAPKPANPFKRKKIKEQTPVANVSAPAGGTTTTAAPAAPGQPAPAAGQPAKPAVPGQPAPAGTMTPPNPAQVKKDQDTLAAVMNNPASPLNAELQALIKKAAAMPR